MCSFRLQDAKMSEVPDANQGSKPSEAFPVELDGKRNKKNSLKIEIVGMSKSFAGSDSVTPALENIDLRINVGEFVCILGESGCGKSTLLQLIAGFQSPTIGEVQVDGLPVMTPSYRRAVVFQEPNLLPWLTVEENVGLGLRIRMGKNANKEPVREILDTMRLLDFSRHRPSELSGGMAQRVAIARALINEPDILLLDEPFSALDVFTRYRLQDELIRLWALNQWTSVFVTHDLDEAISLATRIVVMSPRPGRIARVFNIHLPRPRERMGPEFLRLRAMIGKEFMQLAQQTS